MNEKVKNYVFNFLESVLPYTIYRCIRTAYCRITTKGKANKWRVGYVYKWRPFSAKKYYIVRFSRGYYELFAAARAYIFVAEYVESKGMCPLIDMEREDDFEKGILGRNNIWELCFEQKKIEDVLKENATIIVNGVNETDLVLPETCMDINNNSMDHCIHAKERNWREYYRNIYKYVEKYWKINTDVIWKQENELEEVFKREKILGVSLRENFSEEYFALLKTESAKAVYERHPLGPNVKEIIEIVKDCLAKWNCTKILVATLYEDSIKIFQEEFAGQIIYTKRERLIMAESAKIVDKSWEKPECLLNNINIPIEKDNTRIKEYTREILLLSQCSYLIGAKSGGTIAALMLNGGRYEDIKILEDKRHVEVY